MNKFFSADMHLSHINVIQFCNRPFRDIEHMNQSLIRNWNERVKPEDIVYHVGDFCFYGKKEGSLTKTQVWEEQLNGKIVHIIGNHDQNNSGKEIIESAIMKFGGYKVLVQHIPPNSPSEISPCIDFVLSGHVHEKWKHQMMVGIIPIINVGVDVWNFRPVSMQEILVYYQRLIKK